MYDLLHMLATRIVWISAVLISSMMAISMGLVWRSLNSLQQFSQWVLFDASMPRMQSIPKEIKRLVQAWTEMQAKLMSAKQQQRQFTNDVAHELRSPLSLVYGYLQRGHQQNLTELQREKLAMAIAETERMTQILQDLLDLARAESLDLSTAQEVLILNEFVRDVAVMTETVERRPIQTELVSFAVRVQTNRDYLMQVLDHLIQNAIQYSEPTTPIVLKLNQIQNMAVIQVSDSGQGIPADQQAMVFEPFYRLDPSRARATGGTGLGLAIVQRLVAQMGGTIALESHPGTGSTFTITLATIGESR
jgi:signal transduction histidine kinase